MHVKFHGLAIHLFNLKMKATSECQASWKFLKTCNAVQALTAILHQLHSCYLSNHSSVLVFIIVYLWSLLGKIIVLDKFQGECSRKQRREFQDNACKISVLLL